MHHKRNMKAKIRPEDGVAPVAGERNTAQILIVGGGAAGLSTAGALKMLGLPQSCWSRTRQSAAPGHAATTACTFIRSASYRALPTCQYPALPPLRGARPVRALPANYARPGASRNNRLRGKARDAADGAGQRRCHDTLPWQVETNQGTWQSQVVVLATGQYRVPRLPSWPGRETFTGQLIHSSDYRNGRAWSGKRALVIGVGNSGAEIATDLADAGASFVAISIRTPPFLTRRDTYRTCRCNFLAFLMSSLPPRQPMYWRVA